MRLGNAFDSTGPVPGQHGGEPVGHRRRQDVDRPLPSSSQGGRIRIARWLPIDSKFPLEDYQRLTEAAEREDVEAVEVASRQLESSLKQSAKSLRDKYLVPPATTDFGIIFLPTEGPYAEALRGAGLAEFIEREYRVVLAGPTTLAAILNSLQMGFGTLAIQRRSSEVWQLLGATKTEFGKYADLLSKVKKKLDEASNTIDKAAVRTRAIERTLRAVEVPNNGAETLLVADDEPSEPELVDLTDRGACQVV